MPGTLKLNSGGAGNLILTPSGSVGSDVTVTVPAVTGTVMNSGNMPVFSAYQSTAQTGLGNGTFTKVQFQTERFDTNNCYDNTTNYRFTPNVAGYYQINSMVSTTNGGNNQAIAAIIYRNGSSYMWGSAVATTALSPASQVAAIVYLNGSTDYVEIYLYNAAGISVNTGADTSTQFSGVLVRAA